MACFTLLWILSWFAFLRQKEWAWKLGMVLSLVSLLGSNLFFSLVQSFLFIVGLGISYIGGYLVTVRFLGGVSSGGYTFIFWLFQNPLDLLFARTLRDAFALEVAGDFRRFRDGRGGSDHRRPD